MLQAPSSHLSRVCGHSHYKKFWLMQTQNEAQANVGCDKNGNLGTSTPRCMHSTPIRASDSKHSSLWGTGAPGVRSLLRGGPSPGTPSSANAGARKRVSLLTCAESLTPHLEADLTFRSSHHMLQSLNVKDVSSNIEEGAERSSDEENEDPLPMASPTTRETDSPTSSSCGSPYRNSSQGFCFRDVAKEMELRDTSKQYPDQQRMNGRHHAQCSVADVRFGMQADSTVIMPEPLSQKNALDLGDGSLPVTKISDIEDVSRKGDEDAVCLKYQREHQIFAQEYRTPGRMLMEAESERRQGKDMVLDDADEEGEDTLPEDTKSQNINKDEARCSLRTCSHCGTTKTPLWRSGPHGPKSLCNACGIRFKKSRRCAGSVSEGLDSPGSSPATPNSSRFSSRSLKRKQESTTGSQPTWAQDGDSKSALRTPTNFHKRSRCPVTLPLKRDGRGNQREDPSGSNEESCLTWNMHSPSSVILTSSKRFMQDGNVSKLAAEKINLARIFARDEDEEAAVLLMALSCGLVNA